MNKRKLLAKALTGSKNLRFTEAVRLAKAFGFQLSRVRGSHHVFVHPTLQELVNLQEVGGKAKPYQSDSCLIWWRGIIYSLTESRNHEGLSHQHLL